MGFSGKCFIVNSIMNKFFINYEDGNFSLKEVWPLMDNVCSRFVFILSFCILIGKNFNIKPISTCF